MLLIYVNIMNKFHNCFEKCNCHTQCICNDETKIFTDKCVICKEEYIRKITLQERKLDCKFHKEIPCCGKYDFVCELCKNKGWYSTAGFGGPTQYVNQITGERINKPVVYASDSSF